MDAMTRSNWRDAGLPWLVLVALATVLALHDLCRDGPRIGEPAHGRRFRFRLFVFLDDVQAVRTSGARYLLLHLNMPHGKPFPEAGRCLERLTALYGAPAEKDDRLAVFDLQPGKPPPKLQ
jgi:hypothetical protein